MHVMLAHLVASQRSRVWISMG